MSDIQKRIERLEAAISSDDPQPGAVTSWKDFIDRALQGDFIPGWDEFIKQAKGGTDEHEPTAEAL